MLVQKIFLCFQFCFIVLSDVHFIFLLYNVDKNKMLEEHAVKFSFLKRL